MVAGPEVRTAPFALSMLIAVLAAAAASMGLLTPGVYRDNAWINSAWRGNDLVTLVVAVPLLIGAMWLSMRGSNRAGLVWLALLAYMLYNYAFYLFGAAFNRLFLVYAALFGLSLYALVFTLPRIDAEEIGRSFRARTPVRTVGGFLLLSGLGLGAAWVAASLGFVATGAVPHSVVASGHPTSVVFALDLTLLVPCFVMGGIWLWKRRPWGYVLGAIMSIKGATYTLALAAGSLVAARAGVDGTSEEIPLWLALSGANLIATGLLLGNMRRG